MALYKQIEFAKLCGISTGNLSTYKGRGKIVLTGELIDDQLKQNADFLEKMQAKHGKPTIEKKKEKAFRILPAAEIPFTGVIETSKSKNNKPEQTEHDEQLYALEKRKKTLDIEKTHQQIELLKEEKKKKVGETIPTVLAAAAFSQQFKSIHISYKNFMNKMLLDISKTKDFSRAELAALKGKMVHHLNSAIQDSVTESKKNIALIIQQTANSKDGIG